MIYLLKVPSSCNTMSALVSSKHFPVTFCTLSVVLHVALLHFTRVGLVIKMAVRRKCLCEMPLDREEATDCSTFLSS